MLLQKQSGSSTTPYSEGDPDSPICFIGEAPSFMEMRDNRPFVGPAGNLFDRCLHAAQIIRANSYITNVFEVEVKKVEKRLKKAKAAEGDPLAKEQEGTILSKDGQYVLWRASSGFTEAGLEFSKGARERLSRVKANVIVPLGATALNLCLGEQKPRPVTKWRGSILCGGNSGPCARRKIVGTIHPSASLRGTYEWRYLIISDLQRAKEESLSPEINLPQRRIIINPTFDQTITFLKRILDSPIVNTDIETLNGQVDCFSLCAEPNEIISIPMLNEHFQNRWSLEEEILIWKLYAQILGEPRITKVNQNILFDLEKLMDRNAIVPQGIMHDPMVAFSCRYPFLDKNLATICSFCTREPYYKDDGQLRDSPTIDDFERRWIYNAKDSGVSLESWQVLEPELDSAGYRQTYNIHMNMLSSLIFMMSGGIKVNQVALAETRTREKAELAKVVAKLGEIMQRPILIKAPKKAVEKREALANNAININSPQQLKKYFYTDKNITPYKNKDGSETIDDTALIRIFRRYGFEEAALMQNYRRIAKNIATYLEMKLSEDGRVHCSYNIRGTWTGRLSSAQTTEELGGNMQNLPLHMRGFLESDMPVLEAAE